MSIIFLIFKYIYINIIYKKMLMLQIKTIYFSILNIIKKTQKS